MCTGARNPTRALSHCTVPELGLAAAHRTIDSCPGRTSRATWRCLPATASTHAHVAARGVVWQRTLLVTTLLAPRRCQPNGPVVPARGRQPGRVRQHPAWVGWASPSGGTSLAATAAEAVGGWAPGNRRCHQQRRRWRHDAHTQPLIHASTHAAALTHISRPCVRTDKPAACAVRPAPAGEVAGPAAPLAVAALASTWQIENRFVPLSAHWPN